MVVYSSMTEQAVNCKRVRNTIFKTGFVVVV